MYICKNCGTKFDEPVIKEGDNTIICCSPCCFGDFSEVNNCSVCKQPVINGRICRSCVHKALERFKLFMDSQFTDIEKEYIEKCIFNSNSCDLKKIKELE